jgi:hypothetical protein
VSVALLAFAAQAPAHADEELTKGSGAADATVVALNIPYAGANIGLNGGHVDASYIDDTAKSSALTLDPAFLRLATVLQVCGGAFPVQLTDPTSADTNAAGQRAVSNTRSVAPGVGEESASAEPGAHARSRATAGALGIPEIAEVSGGVSTSEVRLDVAERTRTMTASVRTGSLTLAAGLVQLEGLRWDLRQEAAGADHRSTATTTAGTFSVGSLTLAGIPLPASTPDQLASSLATVNQALAPFGLQIRLPRLVAYGSTGKQLTPLTVALGGATTYGPILYPLLAGPDATSVVNLFNSVTQPALFEPTTCTELFGALQQVPQANRVLNTVGVLAPLLLGVVAAAINGGAELDLEVGGARTTYDDTYYPPHALVPPPTTGPAATGGPPGPAAPVVGPAPSGPAVVAQPVLTRIACRTTSPVGSPGCSKGAAALAASLAAVVTLVLLGGDELWRRRRRPEPLEVSP